MSWRKLAPHFYSAAKAGATGATTMVFSCYLALEIEAASHRTLFTFFPHWYANVESANGIDPELLASVRTAARNEQHKQQQLLAATQPQQGKEADIVPSVVSDENRTETIFALEKFVPPARQRVQDLSYDGDLSACAMTS